MKSWNHLTASSVVVLVVLVFFFALSSSAFGATNPLFSVSLGFDFASGDYGTTETTDSYRIPLIIGYYPTERFDFTLEIPYLYQSNSSTVLLGGMRFPMQNSGGSSGSGGGGGMGGMGGGGSTTNLTNSQSGVGDISLTVGYVLNAESDTTPMIRPLAYFKLPTADKDKGLGTGAFDFGGGLSLGKGFGSWLLYAEAIYVIPGSSSLYKPDNYLTYQGSLRYQLTQKVDTGLALSGATAAFDGNSDALEMQLTSSYRMTQQGSFGAYIGTGLSDGSPDYTAGFYGAISF